MTLIPAYGRDYASTKAVLADFELDRDFIIRDISHPADGKPANRSSLRAEGIRAVMIRYKKLTKITQVKVS